MNFQRSQSNVFVSCEHVYVQIYVKILELFSTEFIS